MGDQPEPAGLNPDLPEPSFAHDHAQALPGEPGPPRAAGPLRRALGGRRGWLLSTLLVTLGAAVMLRLGFWQLDRLAQRRALNAQIEAQLQAPALSIRAPEDLAGLDPAALEYRRALARGRFDHQHEILLRNRALNGKPGYHLVTPLRLGDGQVALLVDRGWVPLEADKIPANRRIALAEPGELEVAGLLRRSQQPAGGLAPQDPPLSPERPWLESWFYLTTERIEQQLPYRLLPLILEREGAPPAAGMPIPQAQVDLGQGSHLSYSIQWFSFATILLAGFAALYRRRKSLDHEDAERDGHVERTRQG